MRLAIVVHMTGTLVRLFGPALLVPALWRRCLREWRDAAGFLSTLRGHRGSAALMRRRRPSAAAVTLTIRRVEGLAIVAATWLVVAHLAAIPYLWAGWAFVDALFESMSGLTTTGATVLTDFDASAAASSSGEP